MLKVIKKIFGNSDTLPVNDAEQARLDGFQSTLMREFCTVIKNSTNIDVHFEDADAFYEGLGEVDPTIKRLRNMDDKDYENVVAVARRILESDKVTEQHIREIVRISLSHWNDDA